jgi:glycogen debranching enzyme
VWPWLLGPYVTALVKIQGDKRGAKKLLRNAKEMLTDCGLGGIAEVYDGDEPHRPGGCPWQAWSVAEILRAWIEDVGGD